MLTEFQDLCLTSRKGSLPNIHELVSINVVKTCERLRLAITQPRNDLQHTLDVTCRHQTEDLSFRSISGLCYTTLRVHELQVNDLLNKSEALVAQSRGWSTLRAKKRSQPSKYSTSYRSKRKRHQIVEHSLRDVSITNYKQLLDETESFVEWSKTEAVVNGKVMRKDSHNRTSCIHIREITINEVDIPSERSDEDEGFGNATADEITTILELLADTSTVPATKPLKRQAMDMSGVCEKKSRPSNVSEYEMTGGGFEHPEIEIPRGVVAVENGVDNHFINESYVTNNSNGMVIQDRIPDEMRSTAEVVPNATSTSSICNQEQGSVATNKLLDNAKFKMKKIIFDECTELSQKEICTQLQAQINIKAKLIKMRAKIEWSEKRNFTSGKRYERFIPSANDLLSKLNRSCITMRSLNLKNKVSRPRLATSTVCSTYRNLLRAILNCEITDDLATQIHKNWNKCEKYNLKNSRQKLQTPVPENIPCLQEENDCNQISLAPNYAIENVVCNNNNNLERTIDDCTPSNVQDEWSAFDVMVKLLNLWRSKKALGDEIPVEYLLQRATLVRKKAAKAFGSLLKLAASGFIVLLPAQYSMQLQRIKLGAASAKLIQKNEVHGTSLRRSKNGYRIHAS